MDVRPAGAEDLDGVADALARAFFDDPVSRWIVPDDDRRPKALRRGYALHLRRLSLRQGMTLTTDGYAGAAVWMPESARRVSRWTELRLLPSMAAAYGRHLARLLRVVEVLGTAQPREPHHYLAFIGVVPEHQGRGLGSALIEPVLALCDRDGMPAYLEASTPRSRELYRRHGFEVRDEITFAPDAPTEWAMWRDPR